MVVLVRQLAAGEVSSVHDGDDCAQRHELLNTAEQSVEGREVDSSVPIDINTIQTHFLLTTATGTVASALTATFRSRGDNFAFPLQQNLHNCCSCFGNIALTAHTMQARLQSFI